MRVAINGLWRAISPSGICRHTASLARCLCMRSEIERVYLLIGSWQEHYFRQILELSHRKLVVKSIAIANSTYSRNFWYLYGLPKVAAQVGAHIVHLSFPVPLNRRGFTSPVVATLHDLYSYDVPANFGYPRVLGNRIALRQCLRHSDRVACVSDFTLNRLRDVFGAEMSAKAARIYNSVDLRHVRERRPALPNLGAQPFLLCVAQHRKNKNLDLLLNGFAALCAQRIVSDETLLVIVGSAGPETAATLKAIASLALNSRVILADSLTDAELAWLYRNTLLLLCTSTIEGFGLSLAEASQYGTRVVCSDIPVFREIASGDCTFFSLTAENPLESLVGACKSALQKPFLPAAQSSLFSAEIIATQYVALYTDLLQRYLAPAA